MQYIQCSKSKTYKNILHFGDNIIVSKELISKLPTIVVQYFNTKQRYEWILSVTNQFYIGNSVVS